MGAKVDFKETVRTGTIIYGTWCILPAPEVVNVIAKAGLDFVYLDLEHGPADSVTLQRMIMAAQAEGCRAVVRVAENSEAQILTALDAGADGILVPHVDTQADCKRAMAAIYYPPDGKRGYSPYTRAGGYSVTNGYTAAANRHVVSGIILEGAAAMGDVAAIIDDQILDFIYVGTYDISVHLGIPGETRHPLVVDVLRRCVDVARAKGKAAACLFHTLEECDFFAEIGLTMLAYKVDTAVLYDGFESVRNLKRLEK